MTALCQKLKATTAYVIGMKFESLYRTHTHVQTTEGSLHFE